ncbi:MAG: FAD-dependent oxidoreductase [Pseudomonadota bacterium]|nr:FAD-dependent oxidoreductase [Pseudomonadota bacterium]
MIFDVVVIGGGVAGLSAMKILQKEVNCLLLEGGKTLGGRVRSIQLTKNEFWDVGAHWIHDFGSSHPFFNLREVSPKVEEYEGFYISADKRMQNLSEEYQIFEKILRGEKYRQRSLSDIQKFFLQCETGCRTVCFQTLNLLDKTMLGDRITLNGYYSLIYNVCIKNIDLNAVRLKSRVIQISKRKNFVSITTTSDTFKAKTVLITPSLAVLKANSKVFLLNKQKINALTHLYLGNAERILFKICDPAAETFLAKEYVVTTSIGTAHIEIMGTIPQHLSVFIPCPLKIRKKFYISAGREIADALNLLSGLVLVYSSNWAQDPLFLGAYSSPSKDGTKWRSILSRPDPPYFFAGEATHAEYFGTVHGAYLSGLRGADQIKDYLAT